MTIVHSQILKHVYAATILCSIALFALVSCDQKHHAEPPQDSSIKVRTGAVVSIERTEELDSFGNASFTMKNDITAAVTGTVTKLYAREGDSVVRGQILAMADNVQLTIRKDQAQAEFVSSQAARRYAEAAYEEYERNAIGSLMHLESKQIEIKKSALLLDRLRQAESDAQSLFTVGGITKKALDESRLSLYTAQYDHELLIRAQEYSSIGYRDCDLTRAGIPVPMDPEERASELIALNGKLKRAEIDSALARELSAETELRSSEALIKNLTFVSPFDGIVGAVYKEQGERINEGERLMVIFDSRQAWIAFPINESRARLISNGMRVSALIEGINEDPIIGSIDVISPTVDPQTGNTSVKALFDNENGLIKPGMFAKLTVITGRTEKALMAPSDALLESVGEDASVFAVSNSRAFRRKIKIGKQTEDGVEVIAGLSLNETIIRNPPINLSEGALIHVAK